MSSILKHVHNLIKEAKNIETAIIGNQTTCSFLITFDITTKHLKEKEKSSSIEKRQRIHDIILNDLAGSKKDDTCYLVFSCLSQLQIRELILRKLHDNGYHLRSVDRITITDTCTGDDLECNDK
jgi:hypothetical protein